MLPTQNKLPLENDYKFNFKQVEKALYNHFSNILKDHKLNYDLKLEVIEVETDLNYSEYSIIFKDHTYYGNDKTIFEDVLKLDNKDIKQLLKQAEGQYNDK